MEQQILTLSVENILNRAILDSIYEQTEPEERERLLALYKLQAKKLNCQTEIAKVIKAYNNADAKLANEYTSKNRTGIEIAFDSQGKPVQSIDNFLKILRHDDFFATLKFNLLSHAPEHELGSKTIRWLDKDDAKARHIIENKYKLHNVSKSDDALRILFAEREYHPIHDIIENIVWDGTERIPHFLTYATHCEDNNYTREVSRLIFSGGIHRLYNAGCKFDDMPVLIGTKQGEGKSTIVRWLALNDVFFTELNEFEGEKAMQALEGAWICEVGELLALTRTKDVEAVKSFITRQNDRRKLPYDKRVTEHYRQCIFIGTTNKEQFLTDKTGNRRFYPVTVHSTAKQLYDNETTIKDYIKQCWAEALHLYRLKSPKVQPFANAELLSVIQEQQKLSVEDDYRLGLVEAYLERKREVCVLELWQNALNNSEHSKPSRKDSNDLVLILQSLNGWEKQAKSKRFHEYGVQVCWKNTEFSEINAGDLPV